MAGQTMPDNALAVHPLFCFPRTNEKKHLSIDYLTSATSVPYSTPLPLFTAISKFSKIEYLTLKENI